MSKKYDFKYIVIGSGPAGSAAALKLAKAKKSVCLIEGRFFGGANLNTRDVPYAVALDFAHQFNKLMSYPELKNQDFSFNFPTIAARELSTVMAAGGNSKKVYEDAGIICFNGYANFLDDHTIAVNQKKFTAENFILATGSHLKTNGITIPESFKCHTPESAIKARRLPEVVAVVGGGSTGCEIANYYAELGSQVILIEASDRLLPREDKEVSDTLIDYFTRKLGITILLDSKVISIGRDEYSDYVVFQVAGNEKLVRVSDIVLATGSEPNLNYGLENTKVKFKNTGIVVDKFFQTSAKHIYAIGDCISDESSTDRAYLEGTALATNLITNSKTPINYRGLTRVVNTYPEVAVVGFTEDDLTKRDRKYKKALIKLDETVASKVYNCDYGFIKLICDKNYHLLGATIVAPNAHLIAEEIALAIRHSFTVIEIASTPHIMNSFNQAIKLAASQLLGKNPQAKTKHAKKRKK